MKQTLFLLVLTTFLFACKSSGEYEVGEKTEIEVQPIVDMGDVQYGETIQAKFKIKNIGNSPLVLAEVKGSCSCTVADYPSEPIPPGEERTLKASIKTAGGGSGPLSKDVRIMANTTPSVTTVIIKANVKNK
jgi:hypothetical protein